jgi:hypothetical protein
MDDDGNPAGTRAMSSGLKLLALLDLIASSSGAVSVSALARKLGPEPAD